MAFIDFQARPKTAFAFASQVARPPSPTPLDQTRHVGALGPYRVLKDGFDEAKGCHGEGFFAKVYLAEDKRDGSQVAVKVLKPSSWPMSRIFANVFNHEASILESAANATSVPNLLAQGKVEGQDALVMELVRGRTLGDQLGEIDTPQKARDVTLALLDAVAQLHEEGCVHGDLNHGNIKLQWVDGRPLVKLLDVGAGGRLEASSSAYTGTRYGGDWFSQAPEQFPNLRNRVTLTPASDLYFVASLYARMLTGKDAFEASSVLPMKAFKASYELRRDPGAVLDVPEGPVREVLLKGLAFNPLERFQTAAEFANAVRTAAS